MEQCTPAVTSPLISLIAYLSPKNEKAYSAIKIELYSKPFNLRKPTSVT